MGKYYTLRWNLLSVLAMVFASLTTTGQVSTYIFSQSTGTYTPITGGTVLGTATGNAIGTPSLDDENYTGVPIPFTFNFDGANYTSLTVNSNGHVVFGTAGGTGNYTPISSTETYSGCISAAGRDLNSLFNISGYTGEIRYETIGSSPNQIFVVQYSNFRPYSTSTSTTTYWRWNFQIRLHETTNAVDVVYDYNFVGSPASSTTTNEVGLRGPNNTFPANVNNRLITNGTHTWTTSVAGTSNSSKCSYNTTLLPPSGLTFTWTPAPACSGAPVAGTTASTANPVCSGTNFTLSLTGATSGVTGLSYQWISSSDNISYSPISGATNATRTDTTTQPRYYRCIITCANGGLSDTSSVLYVTLSPQNQCYCASTYSSGCGSAGADAIINVALNTLSNASGCAASPYYTFYNSVTVPDIAQTIQQTITISFSTDGSQYAGVWIDYNQDGDFDDADEFVANNTVNAGASGVLGLNFTVPLTATLGQTRMRVRGGNDSQLTNTPCGASSSAWGETEDYLVNITAAPPCLPASGIQVNNVIGSSAEVQWSSGVGNTSTLEYGPTGFTPGTGTLVSNATSPYIITGLSAQTAYQVYVIDTCSGGVVAPAAGPVGFTTPCSPFPYTGDTYGSAIVVNTLSFSDSVNTTSSCYTDASPLRTGKDVFYKVIADSCAAQITFSLCGSSFDTYLYITDSSNTTTIGSSDDFCGTASEVTFSVTPGATYYAVIEPYSSTGTGSILVNVTQTLGTTPALATSFTAPSCVGTTDGSASVSILSLGKQPVTYAWNNGGTTATINNIATGTYYVTVTTGCGTAVDTVDVPQAFSAAVTAVTNVTCNGGNDGAIDITALNGTQPYSYLWSNGAVSEDISNLIAGTYCLTVTENGGCSVSVCGVVSEPAAIAIAGNVDSALCAGSSDGEIDVTVTGGTQSVVTAQLSTIFSGGNGCTAGNMFNLQATASVDLTQFDINIATGNYPVSIYYKTGTYQGSETTAAAWTQIYSGTVTGLGNGGPTPVVLPSAFNLPAGQYAFYVNADVDYTNQAVGTTYSTPELTLTVGVGLCNAFAGTINVGRAWNGNIHYTKAQGYNYLWSTGDTTEDVSDLAAGVYSVTITDFNGCTATQSFTVYQPLPILPALDSLVNVSCNGGSNGAVYITVAGGTTPYSFSWSNGSTNEDLTGVAAGIYTGTITDANGCTFVSPQVPITEPTAIVVSVDSVTNVTCNGAANGAVDVSVNGGTPGYSYLWSNSAITEDLSGLSGGNFTLTVTDNNGCTAASNSATVAEPAALTVLLDSVVNNICNGASHGNAYVTTAGGTTPYVYNWSDNSTNEDLTQVAAGNYNLTVTDANGCTSGPLSATISEPAVVAIALDSVVNVLCNGDSNAAVYVTVSGGTGSYTYNWNNGSSSEDIASLAAGTYDLTATDVNGCTASFSQAVTEPTALNPAVDSIVNVACFGGNTGAIYVSVTGGTTPYSFSWSNGGTSEDLVGIPAGNYTGTLTDANGCVSISPALAVTGPSAALSASSVATNQIQGGAQGSVNLSVSGGTSPYTFSWSNGATTEDLSSVAAGIYTCTITDANGCTVTQKDTVDLIIGIEDVVAAYAVNLYPNPTQNNVTVDVTLPVAADVTVMVYSVEGKLIRSMSEKQIANAKFTFNFMDEAEGVYFARIMVDGNVSTHRIVVTR